jgi:hypothetical protein
LRDRSINSLITEHPGLYQANIERDMVILPCHRFWSQIEAVVEASGDLIKQMCM